MNINGTCIASTTDEHGPIYVYQTRSSRILSFDRRIQQSCMNMNDINGLAHSYTQAMMTSLLFIPKVETVTILGLGAGSLVKNLLNSFSDLKVHAIEYREAVAKTAKKYFYLPDDERLTLHIDDAVSHIKHNSIKSDIIFSDLYNTDGMEPKQVKTSYLRDCKNSLNQQGILVLNIWRQEFESQSQLEELLAIEFKNRILSFEVENGNTIVLAFKNKIPLIKRKELLARAKLLQEEKNIPLERYAKLLWSTQKDRLG